MTDNTAMHETAGGRTGERIQAGAEQDITTWAVMTALPIAKHSITWLFIAFYRVIMNYKGL